MKKVSEFLLNIPNLFQNKNMDANRRKYIIRELEDLKYSASSKFHHIKDKISKLEEEYLGLMRQQEEIKSFVRRTHVPRERRRRRKVRPRSRAARRVIRRRSVVARRTSFATRPAMRKSSTKSRIKSRMVLRKRPVTAKRSMSKARAKSKVCRRPKSAVR